MKLTEKYINWEKLFTESTSTRYYTPWSQLINSGSAVSNYCPALLDSNKFSSADIRALDIYFMTHYGHRDLMHWFEQLDVGVSDTTAPTTEQTNARTNLSNAIFMLYGNKWDRLLQVLGTSKQINEDYDYSPTENVFEKIEETTIRTGQMDESNSGAITNQTLDNAGDTDELSIEGKHVQSHSEGVKATASAGGYSLTTDARQTKNEQDHTTERGIAGFNTKSPTGAGHINTSSDDTGGYSADSIEIVKSGQDGETVTESGSSVDENLYSGYKETHTVKQHNEARDTRATKTTYGVKGADGWSDGVQDKRTYNRSGNIGVMTSGQILEGEWHARSHLIYKAMCDDLISYIALRTTRM